MNFTREPIIQTIITPKDGFKLVVKNSKVSSLDEYIVEAVEIISFGATLFYRSYERPKPFIVPVSDYQIVEQRETKVVIKNTSIDKAIKVAGGKDPVEAPEKKKERKRTRKKKQTASDDESAVAKEELVGVLDSKAMQLNVSKAPIKNVPSLVEEREEFDSAKLASSMLPPPVSLISDTIARYKDNDEFSNSLIKPPEVKVEATSHIKALDTPANTVTVESKAVEVDEIWNEPVEVKKKRVRKPARKQSTEDKQESPTDDL